LKFRLTCEGCLYDSNIFRSMSSAIIRKVDGVACVIVSTYFVCFPLKFVLGIYFSVTLDSERKYYGLYGPVFTKNMFVIYPRKYMFYIVWGRVRFLMNIWFVYPCPWRQCIFCRIASAQAFLCSSLIALSHSCHCPILSNNDCTCVMSHLAVCIQGVCNHCRLKSSC